MNVRDQCVGVVLASLLVGLASAADTPVIERRSEATIVRPKTVNAVRSSGLPIILERTNQLQSEVQELRGQVELLTFEIQRIKRQQKDRYRDLDARLNRVELQATSGVQGAAHVSSAEATDTTVVAVSDGTSAVDLVKEEKAYKAAFALLRNQHYAKAEKAFERFLTHFIGGNYADNAQYWLAETRYVQGRQASALTAFRQVVEAYPDSPKVPDAQLKIGYILGATGKISEAKRILHALVKRYPGSSKARLAKKRLLQLKR